jgi:hypothetical protein
VASWIAKSSLDGMAETYTILAHDGNVYTVVYTEEKEGGYSGYCKELSGAISEGDASKYIGCYHVSIRVAGAKVVARCNMYCFYRMMLLLLCY